MSLGPGLDDPLPGVAQVDRVADAQVRRSRGHQRPAAATPHADLENRARDLDQLAEQAHSS